MRLIEVIVVLGLIMAMICVPAQAAFVNVSSNVDMSWNVSYLLKQDAWNNRTWETVANTSSYVLAVNQSMKDYVDSKVVITTTYKPATTATTGGTIILNDITRMQEYDGITYDVREGSGTAPLDTYINFTGVTAFTDFTVSEYYLGSNSHHIQFQIYDPDDTAWHTYWEIVGQSGFNTVTVPVNDGSEHILPGGIVMTRLHHVENGISSHYLYIDYAWLVNSATPGGSTDLTGYAKYSFAYNNFDGSGNFATTGTGNFSTLTVSGGNVSGVRRIIDPSDVVNLSYYQGNIINTSYITSTYNSTYDAKPSSTFNATYDAKPSSTFNSTYDSKPATGYNATYDAKISTGYNATYDAKLSYVDLSWNTTYALTSAIAGFVTGPAALLAADQHIGTNVTALQTLMVTNQSAVWNNGTFVKITNTTYVRNPVFGYMTLMAGGSMVPTTNPATLDQKETATNKNNYIYGNFTDGGSENMQWIVDMPSDWAGNDATNGKITATFLWTATSGTGTVCWNLTGYSFQDNINLDTAIPQLTPISGSVDTLQTVGYMHVSPDTVSGVVTGAGATSNPIVFKVTRNSAIDTLGGTAQLIGVRIKYIRTLA